MCFQGVCVCGGGSCFVCTLGDPPPGGDLPLHSRVFALQKLPEHTVQKYLGCSPCRSSGGKTIAHSYTLFSGHEVTSSRKWTACRWTVFQSCVAKKLAAVQVQPGRSDGVWPGWSLAVGKTSSARRSAVPLACSCSSPAVACALNCGQTAACDSLPCVMWEESELWCHSIQIGRCLDTHMHRKQGRCLCLGIGAALFVPLWLQEAGGVGWGGTLRDADQHWPGSYSSCPDNHVSLCMNSIHVM